MPGQPCANHPNEVTFVRCGRCDKPICVRCMVDTPVGKKCRPCAKHQTHLSESSPAQVLCALVGALVAAVTLGWLAQPLSMPILAFPYGWLVGEVALRAGRRSRSLAVQVVTGIATLAGGVIGAALMQPGLELELVQQPAFALERALSTFPLIFTVLGTMTAVWKVRFL
jgi:hypothetical protein